MRDGTYISFDGALKRLLRDKANFGVLEDANAPGLQEARQKLLFARMSRDEQIAYRRYIDDRVILADQIETARGEGKLEGFAEGRAEGIEAGRAAARMENARSLKANGVLLDVIVKSLSLSDDEANLLKREDTAK